MNSESNEKDVDDQVQNPDEVVSNALFCIEKGYKRLAKFKQMQFLTRNDFLEALEIADDIKKIEIRLNRIECFQEVCQSFKTPLSDI